MLQYTIQGIPEFMAQTVNKILIKKYFLYNNMGSEIKSAGGKTRNTMEIIIEKILTCIIFLEQTVKTFSNIT